MLHQPWLSVQARRRPGRQALDGLTYAALHERAARAAGALGARRGDRVALLLAPGPDLAVALHACLLAGAVAVPLDPRLTATEQAARLGGADLVVDRPLPAGPPHEGVRFGLDDVALVVHTSGTSAEPRPVEITYGNLRASAVGSALAVGLDPRERWLCPLPLAHVGGLMILLRSVLYGTTVLLDPPPFDAGRLAARLQRGEATLVSLVPTMLGRLLDAGLSRPPGLRCAIVGGGPADPALMARAAAAGVPAVQTYGLTEATSQVTVSEPGDAHTAGWPLPGVEVRLAEDGEILVQGAVVAGGGVLRTGDLGRLDEQERLTVVGRKADTIVSGGENVAPAEVEAVLAAHPAVAEAGVYGRPDPEWGEAVVAAVVARPGHDVDPSVLAAWCRERLAPFKVPKAIEARSVLPRTSSGKLLRRALNEPSGSSAPHHPAD